MQQVFTNIITPLNWNTSFYVSLNNIPETLEYTSEENTSIRYYTDSKTTTGPIHAIKLLSGGSGYTQLPRIVGIDTAFSFPWYSWDIFLFLP